MKIRITMKDPDGVYECVNSAVNASVPADLSKDEKNAVAEVRREEIGEVLGKWFEYDEYLVVEVDTEAKTIRVVEVGGS